MKIDMKLTKAALELYNELNKNPNFMTACKGPDANVKKLLDLLKLDLRMLLVQWKVLGLTDPNAIECSNFFPACTFLFYIDKLAKAYPDINNALHRAWDKFPCFLGFRV